ncbi:sarcosine oxidase subunit gamma [Albidovulum sp.]|uniref:sarcosine oxidase subunit gamma n=1 Tax=Albidovulum sp. TaxID=1872424 RepID=UPI0039B93A95
MPSLIETTASEGLLPVSAGGATLSEAATAPITSVAPFRGKERAVAAALKKLGLGWPGPGQSLRSGGVSCLWTGRDQAFLIGSAPDGLAGIAALTDQSDGWARMRLEGPAAEAVLARLVPLDLRAATFPEGSVARSGLNHMMMVLVREGPEAFGIMVFRSMAGSAVHEIAVAMRAVAARPAFG